MGKVFLKKLNQSGEKCNYETTEKSIKQNYSLWFKIVKIAMTNWESSFKTLNKEDEFSVR